MILKVARLGHPAVRAPAKPVPEEKIRTPEFQTLLDCMVDTMREYNGVGLAAPQVHLSLQVAVLEVEHHPVHPEVPQIPLTFLVNPVVKVLDQETRGIYEAAGATVNGQQVTFDPAMVETLIKTAPRPLVRI